MTPQTPSKPLIIKTMSPATLPPLTTTTAEPPNPPPSQPFHAMIYGSSGTGKTSQVAEYCRRQWKQHKRRTRYITFDSGGFFPFHALQSAGVADVWNARDLADAYPPDQVESIIRGIFGGAWPASVNGQLKWAPCSGEILVIEGLDGVCTLLETAWVKSGLKLGQDTVGKYDVLNLVTGKMESGGKISLSHYGAIQSLVIGTLLPSLWKTSYTDIILTTHESNGKDADEGSPNGVVYGPSAIGKAITSKLQQQTPILLRTDIVTSKAGNEYRCYFERHADPNRPGTIGANYPANARIALEAMPKFKAKYPNQYFTLSAAGELAEFIEFWKDLHAQSIADLL
jgi:hypothetical protein